MGEGNGPVLARRRGSVWGLDGLHYPCEEERKVPLSGDAIRLILYLYAALRRLLYPRYELVYVAADQFIYYVPHDPKRNVAPDVWVCYGVPKEPERQVFRTWEEGATPSFVVEVSSGESRVEDRGRKFDLYRDVLRCQEYLIYDEDLKELLLYRREGEAFELAPPAPDGRLYSQEVQAWFGPEPGLLVRIYDRDGRPVADMQELYEQAEGADQIRLRLEEEARELRRREEAALQEAEQARCREEEARQQVDQARRREEEARQQVDQARRREEEARLRADEVAAENERLRGEVTRLLQDREG
jgi:Uma2 family endonuclease